MKNTTKLPQLAALILTLAACLLSSSCATKLALSSDDNKATEPPRKLQVRTTAYTHTEADHLVYGRKTAVGTRLVSGEVNSAAADWSFLPLGTVFKIKGSDNIYVVEDFGSALVGTETVDIYRPSKKSMWSWGVRHVDIEIIEEGCREESIDFLQKRPSSKHCRRMLHSLQNDA